MQIYVDRIKSIMNEMDRTDIEEVYKKMVNKIYMFKENILEIYLTCIPTPVKLRFSSSGKNGNYRIDCEFIE